MTVCVVGLGYVGLPLAEAFARHLKVIGYRRNQEAVDALNRTVQPIIPSTRGVSGLRENPLDQNGCTERFDIAPISGKNAYEKAELSKFMILP